MIITISSSCSPEITGCQLESVCLVIKIGMDFECDCQGNTFLLL